MQHKRVSYHNEEEEASGKAPSPDNPAAAAGDASADETSAGAQVEDVAGTAGNVAENAGNTVDYGTETALAEAAADEASDYTGNSDYAAFGSRSFHSHLAGDLNWRHGQSVSAHRRRRSDLCRRSTGGWRSPYRAPAAKIYE